MFEWTRSSAPTVLLLTVVSAAVFTADSYKLNDKPEKNRNEAFEAKPPGDKVTVTPSKGQDHKAGDEALPAGRSRFGAEVPEDEYHFGDGEDYGDDGYQFGGEGGYGGDDYYPVDTNDPWGDFMGKLKPPLFNAKMTQMVLNHVLVKTFVREYCKSPNRSVRKLDRIIRYASRVWPRARGRSAGGGQEELPKELSELIANAGPEGGAEGRMMYPGGHRPDATTLLLKVFLKSTMSWLCGLGKRRAQWVARKKIKKSVKAAYGEPVNCQKKPTPSTTTTPRSTTTTWTPSTTTWNPEPMWAPWSMPWPMEPEPVYYGDDDRVRVNRHEDKVYEVGYYNYDDQGQGQDTDYYGGDEYHDSYGVKGQEPTDYYGGAQRQDSVDFYRNEGQEPGYNEYFRGNEQGPSEDYYAGNERVPSAVDYRYYGGKEDYQVQEPSWGLRHRTPKAHRPVGHKRGPVDLYDDQGEEGLDDVQDPEEYVGEGDYFGEEGQGQVPKHFGGGEQGPEYIGEGDEYGPDYGGQTEDFYSQNELAQGVQDIRGYRKGPVDHKPPPHDKDRIGEGGFEGKVPKPRPGRNEDEYQVEDYDNYGSPEDFYGGNGQVGDFRPKGPIGEAYYGGDGQEGDHGPVGPIDEGYENGYDNGLDDYTNGQYVNGVDDDYHDEDTVQVNHATDDINVMPSSVEYGDKGNVGGDSGSSSSASKSDSGSSAEGQSSSQQVVDYSAYNGGEFSWYADDAFGRGRSGGGKKQPKGRAKMDKVPKDLPERDELEVEEADDVVVVPTNKPYVGPKHKTKELHIPKHEPKEGPLPPPLEGDDHIPNRKPKLEPLPPPLEAEDVEEDVVPNDDLGIKASQVPGFGDVFSKHKRIKSNKKQKEVPQEEKVRRP